MNRERLIAVLQVRHPLTEEELIALNNALQTIPDAEIGPVVQRSGLGMTAKEMALTISLSIAANFATDAIKSAVEASGLAEKLSIESVLPAPTPTGEPAPQVKAAPPREE